MLQENPRQETAGGFSLPSFFFALVFLGLKARHIFAVLHDIWMLREIESTADRCQNMSLSPAFGPLTPNAYHPAR
jgi:hypothetical protein